MEGSRLRRLGIIAIVAGITINPDYDKVSSVKESYMGIIQEDATEMGLENFKESDALEEYSLRLEKLNVVAEECKADFDYILRGHLYGWGTISFLTGMLIPSVGYYKKEDEDQNIIDVYS